MYDGEFVVIGSHLPVTISDLFARISRVPLHPYDARPGAFRARETAYNQFAGWQRAGALKSLFQALRSKIGWHRQGHPVGIVHSRPHTLRFIAGTMALDSIQARRNLKITS